mmetsp:Transcript_11223/g.41916  ORF Transcript_11223/g.41916 Transcript_11223/m.41916 type:complete len:247 (-) Transcript_11223:63-803(-)|eukprot:scaffold1208_cov231-Pinguiococcus_pyrenoidosus.AAC.9
MSADTYARQQEWLLATQKKSEKAKEEMAAKEMADVTFTPQMKTQAGAARSWTPNESRYSASSQAHIDRQRRARGEHVHTRERSTSAHGAQLPRAPLGLLPSSPSASSAPELGERLYDDEDENLDVTLSRDEADDEAEEKGEADAPEWMRGEVPLEQHDEETFYEQLQRERREWARERDRLLRVIELQQAELSKRSAAVTEKAASIAQTFSSSVVAFEERLAELESSVASELRMLRQRGGNAPFKVS